MLASNIPAYAGWRSTLYGPDEMTPPSAIRTTRCEYWTPNSRIAQARNVTPATKIPASTIPNLSGITGAEYAAVRAVVTRATAYGTRVRVSAADCVGVPTVIRASERTHTRYAATKAAAARRPPTRCAATAMVRPITVSANRVRRTYMVTRSVITSLRRVSV